MNLTRSQLFSTYNRARAAARQGKLDLKRANKALSILQSKNGAARLQKYHTTTRSCGCPDRAYRHGLVACGHMIAVMIARRAQALGATRG